MRGRREYTTREIATLTTMWFANATQRQIADAIGRTPASVAGWIARHNLTRNPALEPNHRRFEGWEDVMIVGRIKLGQWPYQIGYTLAKHLDRTPGSIMQRVYRMAGKRYPTFPSEVRQ